MNLETRLGSIIRHLNSIDEDVMIKGLSEMEDLLKEISFETLNKTITNNNNNNNININTNTTDTMTISASSDINVTITKKFCILQNKIEYNLIGSLIGVLDILPSERVRVLKALKSVLLIHPRSRLIFINERLINKIVNLLESDDSSILGEAVRVLMAASLKQSEILRTIEKLGGVKKICSLVEENGFVEGLEFLFFYLLDETNETNETNEINEINDFNQNNINNNKKNDASIDVTSGGAISSSEIILKFNTASKVAQLKQFLAAGFVDGVVREFINDAPLGDTKW
jgi:hypothetical protein